MRNRQGCPFYGYVNHEQCERKKAHPVYRYSDQNCPQCQVEQDIAEKVVSPRGALGRTNSTWSTRRVSPVEEEFPPPQPFTFSHPAPEAPQQQALAQAYLDGMQHQANVHAQTGMYAPLEPIKRQAWLDLNELSPTARRRANSKGEYYGDAPQMSGRIGNVETDVSMLPELNPEAMAMRRQVSIMRHDKDKARKGKWVGTINTPGVNKRQNSRPEKKKSPTSGDAPARPRRRISPRQQTFASAQFGQAALQEIARDQYVAYQPATYEAAAPMPAATYSGFPRYTDLLDHVERLVGSGLVTEQDLRQEETFHTLNPSDQLRLLRDYAPVLRQAQRIAAPPAQSAAGRPFLQPQPPSAKAAKGGFWSRLRGR